MTVSPLAPNSQLEPSLNPVFDLVIAGGGIVGLALAAALKASGLKIAIVEPQQDSAAAAAGQAYAIHQIGSRILTGIGVWPVIAPQVEAFRQVLMSDGDSPAVVQFQPKDLGADAAGTDALGHVAEHRVLITALQNFLADADNITWFCPASVLGTEFLLEAAHVEVASPEGQLQTLTAKLVVAADGARSPIRQRMEIGVRGWQYWQSCIVVTVSPTQPQPNWAFERFWPSGPFAALPLPNNEYRIVWTAPHAEAQEILALDEPAFVQKLTQRFGAHMGELKLTSRPFLFPAKLMQAHAYVRPRLALIGDAAHCCHPVGGQGLNLGLRDVAALVDVLTTALQQGQDLGDLAVLKRYQRWRRWENGLTLAFTDLLNRSFSNQFWPLLKLRRLGLWLMQRLPLVKILSLRFMAGLVGRVPSLAKTHTRSKASVSARTSASTFSSLSTNNTQLEQNNSYKKL
jgi:2-octaprenyl-6-methoxyphenol hydroxylase